MKNDERLFESLFHRHYQCLYKYACCYIADPIAAEDIVQSFFISIWEKKAVKTVPEDSFLPYAFRAIKNRCINHYKHLIVQQEFLAKLADEWNEQLKWDEKEEFLYKEEVRNALQKLPTKCRKVFLLKCVSDLKYKEIAEITNTSVNTVKYHLTEAFRIMREELGPLFFMILCFFSF